MKKISFLFLMLLAFTVSAMAQSTLPKPANPNIDYWEEAWNPGAEFYFQLIEDWDGNLVADDYTLEKQFFGGEWTTLDPECVTWSIYTDNDQLFTFTPEDFPELSAPITEIPYGYQSGGFPDPDVCSIDESITIHFYNFLAINATDNPFFTWRIGVQVHYTVDGVRTSSDIVYLEVFPQMHEANEVTTTSFLADWTSPENNVQYTGFVGYDLYVIDTATGDTTLIADIPALTQPYFFGEEPIPGRTYLVEGLTPGHTYQYYVVGKHHWGDPTVDIPSNVCEVTLPGSEPEFLRGDVDGNNDVNMDDLSALINYLLVSSSPIYTPGAASCNNANDTVDVNMDDLSALINYLLIGSWD